MQIRLPLLFLIWQNPLTRATSLYSMHAYLFILTTYVTMI